MISIAQNPINCSTNFNPNFKAKTDYSKIYKEMEKISLRREEKIIPKTSFKPEFDYNNQIENVQNWFKKLLTSKNKSRKVKVVSYEPPKKFKFDLIIHGVLLPLVTTAIGAVAGFVIYVLNKMKDMENQPVKTEILDKQNNNESLSKDKTISFEECRSQTLNRNI